MLARKDVARHHVGRMMMADYLTQACFIFSPSAEEVAVLHELDGFNDEGDGGLRAPSSGFIAAFPPTIPSDPLSGYKSFLEENDIVHDGSFKRDLTFEDGQWIYGSADMRLHYVSEVLHRVCKSALPITFSWAATCSRLKINEFGGGYVSITVTGVTGISSFQLLETARNSG